jgi:hypothetical protein
MGQWQLTAGRRDRLGRHCRWYKLDDTASPSPDLFDDLQSLLITLRRCCVPGELPWKWRGATSTEIVEAQRRWLVDERCADLLAVLPALAAVVKVVRASVLADERNERRRGLAKPQYPALAAPLASLLTSEAAKWALAMLSRPSAAVAAAGVENATPAASATSSPTAAPSSPTSPTTPPSPTSPASPSSATSISLAGSPTSPTFPASPGATGTATPTSTANTAGSTPSLRSSPADSPTKS